MPKELPRIGAEVAGYRLISLISRGGMAVVYLAEDVRLRRNVARSTSTRRIGRSCRRW